MSKYSLQTECLENIEAYSDEQFNAEMAVIESAMAIFDKAILMMELSNSDIDLPDCSLFMESTFFQENETTTSQQNAEQPEGAPAPAASENNGDTTNNTSEKKTMTEAERKEHNKEHWVRQTNKNGKVENIFISIIAFIPRFFMFLGRCVKKLFTKTSDKAKDEAVKKADENMQNMTNDQISQAVNSVKTDVEQPPQGEPKQTNNTEPQQGTQQGSQPAQSQPQPQEQQTNEVANTVGSFDPTSHTWNWYNTGNVLAGIRKCMETLTNMQNNIDSYLDKSTNDLKVQIDNCKTIIDNSLSSEKSIQMRGTEVVDSKESIKTELGKFGTLCENLAKAFESKKDTFLKFFERNTDKNAKINEVKQSCEALKTFSKTTAGTLDKVYKAYEQILRDAFAINNAAGNNTQQGTPQPQEGGNPNGGEEQNNPANA